MKNFFFVILFLLGILIFTGCGKKINTPQAPDNNLILAYPTGKTFNALSSGLGYFNNALLSFSFNDITDTLLFSADIPTVAGSDVHITVGVDTTLVSTYNEDTALQVDVTHQVLALMPSPYYSIVNTTGTIAAGQSQATFKIVFYPSRFDVTKRGYLLPVSILSTSGSVVMIDQDMKTVYFHIPKE